MNNTLLTISKRYSCRNYKQDPINEDDLNLILQAGLFAPTALNSKLCHIFALTNKADVDKLAHVIKLEMNSQGLNKPNDYHCAYHSPMLIIVSGPKDYTRRVEDGSCMLENMFLAATSLNIGSCWINQLRDTQNAKDVRDVLTSFGIPENHLVVGCVSLGYPNDTKVSKDKDSSRIHIIK